jgi:uncharacterized protein YodC (DUF2158 family)
MLNDLHGEDLVRLKAGGPVMTVRAMDGRLVKEAFSPVVLEKVSGFASSTI